MTEADWLGCTDPTPMLEFLGARASNRKLRLFACSCCRRHWELLPDHNCQSAVEFAERYADQKATLRSLAVFRLAAERSSLGHWPPSPTRAAALAAARAADECRAKPGDALQMAGRVAYLMCKAVQEREEWAEAIAQCDLIHDIFTNPFRPPPPLDPALLAWQDATLVRLAQAAYQERELPSGHLSRERLTVLADALEEAGCTDPELLGHLRDPGQVHVRGCWVVDLILGKS